MLKTKLRIKEEEKIVNVIKEIFIFSYDDLFQIFALMLIILWNLKK